MPSITLNRDKVVAMLKLLDKFFVAKDHGAYVGVNGGKDYGFESVIYYFKGCDPVKDEDWYDECHAKFGGDDFGEMLDAKSLVTCLNYPATKGVRINVSKSSITISAVM